MRPTLSTLLKTVTGKVITGVLVATMGVGAAAAAGADVVPSFVDEPAGEQVEPAEPADESELPGDDIDDGGDAQDQTADEESGDDEERVGLSAVDEPGSEVEDEGAEDESGTHGDMVSDFVHETDFEGCEKGQATAAVARGDVDPTADEFDVSEFDPYIERCNRDDGEGEDADAEDADADWKNVRDDGKSAVQELQAAADEICGDTDTEDEAIEDESPECTAALADVKTARDEWKSTWKTARDESKAERQNGKSNGNGASNGKSNGNGNGKKSNG